jgi:hypothetical protein
MQARATEQWATWARVWRYVAGIAACLLLGWFAFVRGTRVPLLGLVDLGFHELGHLVTYVAPDVVTAAMGSITQLAVPLGLAGYFAWRRDLMAGGVCLAWAATSAQDVSVYVGDAPFQRLQLIGGEHDWAYLLGPQHLDLLHRAGTIAGVVKGVGALLLVTGIAACGVGLTRVIRVTPSTRRLPTRVIQNLTRASMWK